MATASNSLFNMTVPSGGTNSSGLLMPKLQYRFRAEFLNFGTGDQQELTKQVIDITRPSLTFTEIPIDIYNSKMYLAGKHEWAATTINLRDDAGGNISKLVGAQLQKQMDFVEQASAATGQDYKFQVNYQVLDGGNGQSNPGPQVLETWELYGCFIQQANYNNMNYSTNEPVTISLTIRFDNAIQSPLENGLGVKIGRGLAVGSITGIGT